MLLTVIVPDLQPGMERMLKNELEGINAEVIKKSWTWGLKKAKGDYICLLERDSAVSPGTIRRNLEAFTSNQAYRKLAMVSPSVDHPRFSKPISWTYRRRLTAIGEPASREFHSVRIGQLPGAVIRRSSLKKANLALNLNPYVLSTAFSLFCWENGLRIAFEPEGVYYVPENASYAKNRYARRKLKPGQNTLHIWEREMIT